MKQARLYELVQLRILLAEAAERAFLLKETELHNRISQLELRVISLLKRASATEEVGQEYGLNSHKPHK